MAQLVEDGLSRSGSRTWEEGEKIQNLLTKHRLCSAMQFVDAKDVRNLVISLGLLTICKPRLSKREHKASLLL